MDKSAQILKMVEEKGKLKQIVFDNTLNSFNMIKSILSNQAKEFNQKLKTQDSRVRFEYRNAGLFQCEFRVAGDLLVFYMHTNVFEFDRDHKIWTLPLAKQDKDSTYSGIISIFNFLNDSFKYNRSEDLGYLIARIFINNKKFYFVEGKQQMGYLSNDFGTNEIDEDAIKGIIQSAILYSLKFDLLVPPYDQVKIVNVDQILESRRQGIQTGKRLGFSFNSDDITGGDLLYTGG